MTPTLTILDWEGVLSTTAEQLPANAVKLVLRAALELARREEPVSWWRVEELLREEGKRLADGISDGEETLRAVRETVSAMAEAEAH